MGTGQRNRNCHRVDIGLRGVPLSIDDVDRTGDVWDISRDYVRESRR